MKKLRKKAGFRHPVMANFVFKYPNFRYRDNSVKPQASLISLWYIDHGLAVITLSRPRSLNNRSSRNLHVYQLHWLWEGIWQVW